jgi:mannonate dehydratase
MSGLVRNIFCAPKLFELLRLKHGDEMHPLHDVHHRLTPIEAARLVRNLEPYHLFWRDPVAAELPEGFRAVRQHTTTPLAVGEAFTSVRDAHLLMGEQLMDYIRMTVVHGRGIPPLKKIAARLRFITSARAVTARRITPRLRWRSVSISR